MRSALSYTITMLLLACGPSSASEPRETTAGSGGESTTTTPAAATDGRVRAATAPPTLSDEVVSADAADPALVVSPESGWVVIPSFRLGVAMPDDWYWSNAEEMILPAHSESALQSVLRSGDARRPLASRETVTDASSARSLKRVIVA